MIFYTLKINEIHFNFARMCTQKSMSLLNNYFIKDLTNIIMKYTEKTTFEKDYDSFDYYLKNTVPFKLKECKSVKSVCMLSQCVLERYIHFDKKHKDTSLNRKELLLKKSIFFRSVISRQNMF